MLMRPLIGVARDTNGFWWGGFHGAIGKVTTTLTKLWTIFYATEFVWHQNWKALIESDSNEACEAINFPNLEHPGYNLIDEINRLWDRQWKYNIKWVARKVNQCADRLSVLANKNVTSIIIIKHYRRSISPNFGNLGRRLLNWGPYFLIFPK